MRNPTGAHRAKRVLLIAGPYHFTGVLETQTAPASTAWLTRQFPLEGKLRHARWSGEAAWLPLNGAPQLAPENATAHPRPGQILLYGGAMSQAELLIPYGACAFASKAGTLAGSPVITLEDSFEDLGELGSLLIWKGVQPLRLNWLPPGPAESSVGDKGRSQKETKTNSRKKDQSKKETRNSHAN